MKNILRIGASALLLFQTNIAFAQTASITDTTLTLEPHCAETDRTKCTQTFHTLDAERLQTDPLSVGDILDVDIVLRTPTPEKVSAVRGWLSFNPTVLDARNVELTSALPTEIPGEKTADAAQGIVKIGGSTNNALTQKEVAVARVTFQVKSAIQNVEVMFYEYSETDPLKQTAVIEGATGSEKQMLLTEPATLVVTVNTTGGSSQSSQSSMSSYAFSSTSSMQSSASSMPVTSGAFGSLQVQNVRITSQDNNVFVGWQSLASAEIVGYNVYYGTVSGRYIQRRTIDKSTNSLVIRDLEAGLQYFVAVRAYNATNTETVFSQEVSVVVGRPETSTAPLTGQTIDGPDGENPVGGSEYVPGETGLPETMAAILVFASIVGTMFAWRRQFILPDHQP